MHVEDSQIKDFIIDAGLISKSEVEDVEKEAKSKKKPLSDILISKGKFSDDDLRRVQAYILGIPFINLKGQILNRDILNKRIYAIIQNYIHRNVSRVATL